MLEGVHHVAYVVSDMEDAIRIFRVFAGTPFVAGTGWKIAYFDFEKSSLDLLKSCYHGDHLAETGTASDTAGVMSSSGTRGI